MAALPLSSQLRQMCQEKTRAGIGRVGDPAAGSAPYRVVTLSREIVRQWLMPVAVSVHRSMRANRPSTRGR